MAPLKKKAKLRNLIPDPRTFSDIAHGDDPEDIVLPPFIAWMHGVGPLPTKSNGLLENNKRENPEQDDEREDQQKDSLEDEDEDEDEDEPEDKKDATYTPSKVEPAKPHTRQLRPRNMAGNMKRKGGVADKEEPSPIEKNPSVEAGYVLLFLTQENPKNKHFAADQPRLLRLEYDTIQHYYPFLAKLLERKANDPTFDEAHKVAFIPRGCCAGLRPWLLKNEQILYIDGVDRYCFAYEEEGFELIIDLSLNQIFGGLKMLKKWIKHRDVSKADVLQHVVISAAVGEWVGAPQEYLKALQVQKKKLEDIEALQAAEKEKLEEQEAAEKKNLQDFEVLEAKKKLENREMRTSYDKTE